MMIKEIREHFDLTYTTDDRVRLAKQHLSASRVVWRFVWRDDMGDWAWTSTFYLTKGELLAAFPQFLEETYGVQGQPNGPRRAGEQK